MLDKVDYLAADEADRAIYDITVPSTHYLRKVAAVINFDACREELASCYHAGHGRPAKEPLLMVKLEFLQFHYGLSDREVMEEARINLTFRWFLGLSLRSPLPHHTLLTKFRERLGVEMHQKIFDTILAQARCRGLVKDRLRLKDATHVIANIAIPSAVRLVAETREKLLDAVRPYAAERVTEEDEHAALIRTTTADLKGGERLLQRVTHVRAIVAWVEQLLSDLGPAKAEDRQRQKLIEALALAHKVLADREPKASDKVVSVQDPEARWGQHGDRYVGYNLDVMTDADSEIITGVNVLPANGDEAADASTLIRQEEQVHGNDVQALSIDGIGFRGPLLREWTDPAGLNLQVFVPPRAEPRPDYFTVDQFTLDAAGTTLTCPAGQTTTSRHRDEGDRGWVFRFRRSTCAACPLRPRCIKKLSKTRGRPVYKSAYEAEHRAARAKVGTPEYQTVRRQHWRIERKLAEMIRWHGARWARYRGQAKVMVQQLMTAVVINVKRVLRLLQPGTVRAELAPAP
jgi:transposase